MEEFETVYICMLTFYWHVCKILQLYNIVVNCNKYLQAYFWCELAIAPTVLHGSIGLSIVYIISPSI